jgi:ATP-dependent Lon protease
LFCRPQICENHLDKGMIRAIVTGTSTRSVSCRFHALNHHGHVTLYATPGTTSSVRRSFRSSRNGSNNSKKLLTKDSDSEESSSSSSTPTSSTVVPIPTKLPFGEASPRMPHMTAIPLISRPLFPGLVTSITLTDEATIEALDQLTKQQDTAYISCFLRAKYPSGVSDGGVVLSVPEVIKDSSDIYHTGTFAQIQRLTRGVPNPKPVDLTSSTFNDDKDTEDTAATLILLAHRRVNLVSVDDIGPPIDVTVNHWPRMEYTGPDDSVRALSNEVISTIREVAQMNVLFRENLQLFPMRFDANDPFKLADFAASITASGTPEELQSVLEEKDPERRLHKALVLLIREREVSKLQKEISAKVEEKMTEAQRKYFLTEQLKSIKKELGMERDDKDALIEKFRKKLSEYNDVPTEAMETIEAELEKFSALEKNSSEYNVTRSYLDWLVAVPWGVHNPENFDIKSARVILDRDHYGLDDVKDTILQFIAIGKLKGSVQGRILCLAGPPGTGKTSIAKSVADSLGRKFYRFSVGGLSDVSEIKGHRR